MHRYFILLFILFGISNYSFAQNDNNVISGIGLKNQNGDFFISVTVSNPDDPKSIQLHRLFGLNKPFRSTFYVIGNTNSKFAYLATSGGLALPSTQAQINPNQVGSNVATAIFEDSFSALTSSSGYRVNWIQINGGKFRLSHNFAINPFSDSSSDFEIMSDDDSNKIINSILNNGIKVETLSHLRRSLFILLDLDADRKQFFQVSVPLQLDLSQTYKESLQILVRNQNGNSLLDLSDSVSTIEMANDGQYYSDMLVVALKNDEFLVLPNLNKVSGVQYPEVLIPYLINNISGAEEIFGIKKAELNRSTRNLRKLIKDRNINLNYPFIINSTNKTKRYLLPIENTGNNIQVIYEASGPYVDLSEVGIFITNLYNPRVVSNFQITPEKTKALSRTAVKPQTVEADVLNKLGLDLNFSVAIPYAQHHWLLTPSTSGTVTVVNTNSDVELSEPPIVIGAPYGERPSIEVNPNSATFKLRYLQQGIEMNYSKSDMSLFSSNAPAPATDCNSIMKDK